MDMFEYVSAVGRVIVWSSAAFIAVSFAWAWACVLPHYAAEIFSRALAARYGAKARALRASAARYRATARALRAKIDWLKSEPD